MGLAAEAGSESIAGIEFSRCVRAQREKFRAAAQRENGPFTQNAARNRDRIYSPRTNPTFAKTAIARAENPRICSMSFEHCNSFAEAAVGSNDEVLISNYFSNVGALLHKSGEVQTSPFLGPT